MGNRWPLLRSWDTSSRAVVAGVWENFRPGEGIQFREEGGARPGKTFLLTVIFFWKTGSFQIHGDGPYGDEPYGDDPHGQQQYHATSPSPNHLGLTLPR